MCNFLKRILLTILVTGMLILSTSCERQQKNEEIVKTETTNPFLLITQTLTEQAISSVRPSATEFVFPTNNELPRTKYDLYLWYDYSLGILNVDYKVTYFNATSQDLERIPFVLPFKSVHEFKIGEIFINHESQPAFEINNNALIVTLLQPLRIGKSVSISFTYSITIPDIGGVLGRKNQQINLADFYPMVPPYSVVDGWIMHEPGTVGEYLVYELSDFNLELSTNAPEDINFFSNSPIKKSDDVYRISAENYRNVVISMCTACTRIEKDYGDFTVIGSFDSQDESIGQDAINIIAKALSFFSELFGVDYPHSEMTIIEADFPDGMEYDGLFFLSKDYFDHYNKSFKNYLSLLIVHETAHQWWFGLVANDQASEPWLDEALATYSEYLFLEEFYPELLSWWWDFRINSYNPTGSIDSDIYGFDRVRPYINAVYLRGAVFIHELRTLLTDDVFFLCLRQYTEVYQGMVSNAAAFKNIFLPELTPEVAGLLEKFFDQ